MRRAREFALQMVRENEGNAIQEAGLAIAATHIYELLLDFDPATLREKLDSEPANYARIVGALAKLSDGGLKYERYRAEVAEKKAQIEKELAGAKEGGLTEEAIAEIEKALKLL